MLSLCTFVRYIKNFIKLSRGVSRGISIVGRKEPLLAVQLLQEMIADEPGAVIGRWGAYECTRPGHEEKLVTGWV
jgi:hypothetical protein